MLGTPTAAATATGSVSASVMQGEPKDIVARSALSAARAGAVIWPLLGYNAAVWANNNTPIQDWIASGIDKVTGLDQSGNNYDGVEY